MLIRKGATIMKEYMISIIRKHQYYEAGTLEAMNEEKVREIYESIIDWIE